MAVGAGAFSEDVSEGDCCGGAKPWLFVEAPKANDAVQFYEVALGAEDVSRTVHPKRKAEQELQLLLAVELKLGSFSFLVSDLTADDSRAPVKTVGGGVALCPETEVEAAVEKAGSAAIFRGILLFHHSFS